MTLLNFIILGVPAAIGLYVMLQVPRLHALSQVRVTPTSANDDEYAFRRFLELLEEAKHSMLVYDDGDATSESLYERQEVVEAIQAKLEATPKFEMVFLFNLHQNTLVRKTFENDDHVKIYQRPENDQRRVHYKIIDGKKAYVSRHALGSNIRNVKEIDCTPVDGDRNADYVRQTALGEYLDDFSRHVPASV